MLGGGRWSKKTKTCQRSLWTPPYRMSDGHILFCFSVPGECLVINKVLGYQMTLVRRGEKIALNYVAPMDFDERTQSVVPKLANVQNFIKRLKNRNDPVPSTAERLQFHAHSLQTLAKSELKDGKNLDERLNSALNFLSNQLSNWILKCTEYNKLPNFVPSAIRLALLVRNQSKAAYLVSFLIVFTGKSLSEALTFVEHGENILCK